MLVAIMPPDWRPVDAIQVKLAEQIQVQALHHTLDEVRAVDAVFTGSDDPSDAAFGAMGLTLAAPWLIDVLADALKPARDRDEEEPKPRLKDEETE